MLPFKKFLLSSIGKKYVMAVTGLALIGFLITHLAANLTLLTGNPDLINAYGHTLKTTLGPFFYPAELGLLAMFFIHAALAAWIHFVEKPKATGGSVLNRGYSAGVGLESQRSKGGPSKFGLASVNMIVSGLVILFFLVFHLWQIRYQWQWGSKRMTDLDGQQVTDLYGYCQSAFADWWVVVIYVGTVLLLGLHLRHGFWSWIQSLGAMKPEWSKGIHIIAWIVAAVFAVGFLIIPIWMHFDIAGKLQ